ncbi:hypothetical protein BYT27DRAFT_7243396 [Phlegmacium glaucopus]|nr:hypothetical protein BYT27DRAFT_7243396 [Phlegmacium glaucopus]
MLFNTRTILGYVLAALAGVPALTSAATLGGATTDASAAPQDLPKPACYSGSSTGPCSSSIANFCAGISSVDLQPHDTAYHCDSELKTTKNAKYKCVLGVRNSNTNQDATPDKDECVKVMQNIADNCSYGGHGKFASNGAIVYLFDNSNANKGVCTDFTKPTTL